MTVRGCLQSYYRGYRARQRVASLAAMSAEERAARKAASEALLQLMRQRAMVAKLVRTQAKDMLLAVQAQTQYNKTRDRLMRVSGGQGSRGSGGSGVKRVSGDQGAEGLKGIRSAV